MFSEHMSIDKVEYLVSLIKDFLLSLSRQKTVQGGVDLAGQDMVSEVLDQSDLDDVVELYPREWTLSMREVFMAMRCCQRSGRVVSCGELSQWLRLSESEVSHAASWLVREGKLLPVGSKNGWICVWRY